MTDVLDRPKRRRAVTVELLLDAALETFAEIGFAAASVEDICSRGGFTRGAFYSSFKTKDELFAALYARETARELQQAEEKLAGIEQESDPVGAAVERCLAAFRADRTWVLVRTEYALHAARNPEARAALHEHTEALHTQLTGLIERTVQRSGLTVVLPPDQLARIVLALHDGFVVNDVVEDGAETDLEHTALLLLLRAVIPN
jgi:AcrR family transcriptional regulator